jgi:hypothetical protein
MPVPDAKTLNVGHPLKMGDDGRIIAGSLGPGGIAALEQDDAPYLHDAGYVLVRLRRPRNCRKSRMPARYLQKRGNTVVRLRVGWRFPRIADRPDFKSFCLAGGQGVGNSPESAYFHGPRREMPFFHPKSNLKNAEKVKNGFRLLDF